METVLFSWTSIRVETSKMHRKGWISLGKLIQKLTFSIFAVFMLVMATNAEAEHGPGNSGHAVEIDGKFYLRDFVEAGLTREFQYVAADFENYQSRVGQWAAGSQFSMFKMEEQERVSQVLGLIESASPFAATMIYSSILLHQWKFVEFPLKVIPLVDGSVQIPDKLIYQAAIRRGRSIQVHKTVWESMDLDNRVGLIFHEAIYALILLEKDTKGYFEQYSWNARQIVSDLFIAITTVEKTADYRKSIHHALRFMSGENSALPFMKSTDPQGWGGNPFGVYITDDNRLLFARQKIFHFEVIRRMSETFSEIKLIEWDLAAKTLWSRRERTQSHNSDSLPIHDPKLSQWIADVCAKALGSSPGPTEIVVGTESETYEMKFASYERPEGTYNYLEVEAHKLDFNQEPVCHLDDYEKKSTFTTSALEECISMTTKYYAEEVYEYSRQFKFTTH